MVFFPLTAVRLRRAWVAALALAAVLIVAAPPAQPAFAAAAPSASAAEDDCDYSQDPRQCNYLFLYRATDFGGPAERFVHQPDNTCTELTSPMTAGSHSVENRLISFGHGPRRADTPGQAVLLFAGAGCTGASYRFSAGSSSRDLSRLGFAAAVSIKFIADPCIVYFDQNGGSKNHNVCVYADAEDTGVVQVFPSQPVNTCLAIQPSLQRQVTSIRNHLYERPVDDEPPTLQQDVLLFANADCTGADYRSNASTGHPDLSEQGFDNRALSIKFVVDPCQYDTSLCLWANVDFDGPAQIIVAFQEGSCANLAAAVKGQVSSYRNQLSSPKRQDVALYAGDNCTGASKRLDAGSAKSDLKEIGFDNMARSVRFVTDSCRWGEALCLYTDADFEGDAQVIKFPAARSCVNLRTGISGQVSSLRNWLVGSVPNSYYDVAIYTGTGCTGTTETLYAGITELDLAGTPFDNSIKSVKFLPR